MLLAGGWRLGRIGLTAVYLGKGVSAFEAAGVVSLLRLMQISSVKKKEEMCHCCGCSVSSPMSVSAFCLGQFPPAGLPAGSVIVWSLVGGVSCCLCPQEYE